MIPRNISPFYCVLVVTAAVLVSIAKCTCGSPDKI